jgi:glycosyltransferase involved in cell wall biosynthesis
VKPRICHISTAHSPDDIRIFKKECNSLAEAGYDVHLIAPPKTEVKSEHISVHYLSKDRLRFNRMWSGVNEVVQLVDTIKPSVVHLHDPELLRIVSKFKSRGIKVVYDAHEDLPQQVSTKSYIPRFLRPVVGVSVNSYMKRQLKKCSAIVAATPHIASQLSGIGPIVHTVCNYPIINQTPDVNRPWNRTVCYIGSITESRGIIQMLDSISYMDDVEFDLVGPFGSNSLEERCRQHPNWEKVRFHGPLYGTEASNIMKGASIGLVLLQPFPSYEKALPVKMFEYMNHSLPVLASDFDLWSSILKNANAGVCVDSSSPVEIGRFVNRLLSDQEELERMGMAGSAAVMETYNWKSEVNALLKLYQDLNLAR